VWNEYSDITKFLVTTAKKFRTLTRCTNFSVVLGRSRSSSLSFQCIVSIIWILIMCWCRYVKCSIVYKERCLQLTICAYYTWEMALNISLDLWFGIWEETREDNGTTASINFLLNSERTFRQYGSPDDVYRGHMTTAFCSVIMKLYWGGCGRKP
jgi:hypothetical protein